MDTLNKYLVPLRPLLVFALILSAYFFIAPNKNDKNTEDGKAPMGITSIATDEENISQNPASDSALLPTQSLFATLFGTSAVDPFLTLPEITVPNTAPAQENIYSAPEEEPARSIYQYLVEASNVGFKANPSRLGLALATAEQGELGAINSLISEMERSVISYASLLPPIELEELHLSSVALLESYIAHMRNSRDRADGTVEITWNNSNRDAIAEEASRITEAMREIVHNYSISLPPDVLP